MSRENSNKRSDNFPYIFTKCDEKEKGESLMTEWEKMASAQLSRDDFVPWSPPGKMDWCPQCGAWSLLGECEACRRREEVLRLSLIHISEPTRH